MKRTLFLILFAAPSLASAQAFISASLEQFNHQIGPSTISLRSYDAFDQLSDITEFPGVTGVSVRMNGGPSENVAFNPIYDAFKQYDSWGSVAEMVAARPIDASFAYTLTGSPSGTVTINAPNLAYEDAIPNSPIFTFGGVGRGIWIVDGMGRNVFLIDGGSIGDSFTVALNSYTLSGVEGDLRFSNVHVGVSGSPAYSYEDVQSHITDVPGAVLPPISLSFTRGIPANGGDADSSTYGFGLGVLFALEGEFGNIFDFGNAGLGDETLKGFVYQNNTSLYFRVLPAGVIPPAVPLPAAWLLMASGMLLLGAVRRRVTT